MFSQFFFSANLNCLLFDFDVTRISVFTFLFFANLNCLIFNFDVNSLAPGNLPGGLLASNKPGLDGWHLGYRFRLVRLFSVFYLSFC